MTDKKLKFGILCNSPALQQWQANAIQQLLQHPNFELCLILQNNSEADKPQSLFNKLFSRTLFFRQYETRFLKITAKQSVDMSEEFAPIPLLKIIPNKKGKYSQYFTNDDVETIKNYGLDFIVRFGFGILKGEILNAAKYGVWSYHHGDKNQFRGGPPGFWEIFYSKPTTAAILQRLTSTLDGGVVMKKGCFKTIHHSYAEQVDTLFTHTSSWIKQVGLDILYNDKAFLPPSPSKSKIHKAPTNTAFLVFLLKLLYNKIAFKLNSLFRVEIWSIGQLQNTIDDLVTTKNLKAKWWNDNKKLSYRADPFTKEINGQQAYFFERFNYNTHKGHIAMAWGDNGEEKAVIQNNKHYSYPFIFSHEGENYCLPECFESNGIELYKIETDGTFALQKTLLQGLQVVDPTLLYHNNKFWLFFTQKTSLPNAELYIYHADGLLGDYTPHLLNPVKTDIVSARPAGNIFIFNDKYVRPAQNCSTTYGGSLVLNHIVTLTETEFKEEKLTEIFPFDTQQNKGIHHVCVDGDTIIIDGKKYIYSLQQAIKRIVGQ